MSKEERERKRAERKRKSRNIRFAVSASVLTLGLIGIGSQISIGEEQDALDEEFVITVGDISIITPEVPLSDDLQISTQEYCRLYDVPYSLALAVIQTESSFQSDAVNENCYGYMQIHSIHKNDLYSELCVTDLMDPRQNIHSGIYLLSHLYEKYGDWNLALVAYNNGETGAFDDYFSQGLYSSSYSEKVRSRQKYWEGVIG